MRTANTSEIKVLRKEKLSGFIVLITAIEYILLKTYFKKSIPYGQANKHQYRA
jgi:uncharacterized protein YhhL (DUF1145 family)